MNRLPIHLRYPEGYTPDDFNDILTYIIDKITPQVKTSDKGIYAEINLIDYTDIVEKNGEKFKVSVFGFWQELQIRIEKLNG